MKEVSTLTLMIVMSPELRKAVKKTITFMEKHPWCREEYTKKLKFRGKQQTHYCMMGAFGAANHFDPSEGSPIIERAFIDTFNNTFKCFPSEYNDDVATKKERVIGKLRAMLKSKPH